MPLQPGTRLGPYVIEGRLGAGGMGDVYKARDSRLDRTVAIKTIASDLIGDPDRRHRFDREARASRRCRTRISARSSTSARTAAWPTW